MKRRILLIATEIDDDSGEVSPERIRVAVERMKHMWWYRDYEEAGGVAMRGIGYRVIESDAHPDQYTLTATELLTESGFTSAF